VDDPVAIDEIKKFLAQLELDDSSRFVPKKLRDYSDKKIAVIGSGPAGLSCAYYLALDNYSVTVFEKNHSVGGMLRFGIPSFRLEKDVVDAEIRVLEDLGVEFKTGVEVGKDVTIPELREQGYEGFYLAIGAQNGRALGIEGEDADGVIAGVEFLQKVNLDPGSFTLEGKTVIIGGGNVAIDVARTATRVGSDVTELFCLESRDEMPAMEEEQEEAEAEGVVINNNWGPKRILTKDGKVSGVEFRRCVSVFDISGRFAPSYDEDVTMTVECDNVLVSVGQAYDYGRLLEGTRIELNPNGTVKADPLTYQTAEPDVFTGGDVYTGPKFAIDAIAAGKQGAISLHRFVRPGQTLELGRDRREYLALDTDRAIIESFDNTGRQKPSDIEIAKAASSFRDARGTFTEEQVKKETERCLGCGAVKVDEFMCVGCGQCTTKCKFEAISLERVYDGQGVSFEKMKPIVLKTAVKTMAKIKVREFKDALSGKKA
jgi:NADPH-dependent glutamate synthase beta subunit-like oxidoreductase